MARVSCGVLCPVLVLLDGCIASGPNGLRVVRRPSCVTLATIPVPGYLRPHTHGHTRPMYQATAASCLGTTAFGQHRKHRLRSGG